MNTQGRHLLIEYSGCSSDALNDVTRIRSLMETAALAAHMTIVASVFQPFEPHGVSGVVVVEESHLSIHTWPEHGYAAVDLYTCGEGDPEAAHAVLMFGFQAQACEQMYIERGSRTHGMQVLRHTYDDLSQEAGAEHEAVSATL